MPRISRARRRLGFADAGSEIAATTIGPRLPDLNLPPSRHERHERRAGASGSQYTAPCAYCMDPRCNSARAPVACIHCDVRVFADVDERANTLANSPLRAAPVACCVCEHGTGGGADEDNGPKPKGVNDPKSADGASAEPERRVFFVPPCFAAHAVCAKCMFRWLTTGNADIPNFFSCVMCRAQIRMPLSRFWFACLLASGADRTDQTGHHTHAPRAAFPGALSFTLTPFGSRASILRDVRAGSLSVRTACMILGSTLGAHDDDDGHEPSRCAVPEGCFQCAALAWAHDHQNGERAHETAGSGETHVTHVTPQSARSLEVGRGTVRDSGVRDSTSGAHEPP